MEIKSGCSRSVASTVELVGTPSSMETTSVATKVSRRLTVREEGCGRSIGHGQQRLIDNSRPHGGQGHLVKEFVC